MVLMLMVKPPSTVTPLKCNYHSYKCALITWTTTFFSFEQLPTHLLWHSHYQIFSYTPVLHILDVILLGIMLTKYHYFVWQTYFHYLGDQGNPGPQGQDGDDGARGEIGQKGEPGSNSANGAPGIKGDMGDPGTHWERGQRGSPGYAGQKGCQVSHCYIIYKSLYIISDDHIFNIITYVCIRIQIIWCWSINMYAI